jgi:hypothetical protein
MSITKINVERNKTEKNEENKGHQEYEKTIE